MMSRPENFEIELKLRLKSACQAQEVLRILKSEDYHIRRLPSVEQQDDYYDSYDWILLKNKYAIRLRRMKSGSIWALKGIAKSLEGITSRVEIEQPENNPPEKAVFLVILPDGEIKNLIQEKLGVRSLLHHITIRTKRDRYEIKAPENVLMELVIDECEFISTGIEKKKHVTNFKELEIELLEGDLHSLHKVSSILHQLKDLKSSEGSKFENAIEKLGLIGPQVKPKDRLLLVVNDTILEAVHKILQFQNQRMEYLLKGVQKNYDSECVHQARVATRRLRTAIKIFKRYINIALSKEIRRGLKELGQLLGSVRDLEVFESNDKKHLLRLSADMQVGALPELSKWIQNRKESACQQLNTYLSSSIFRQLQKQMNTFLTNNKIWDFSNIEDSRKSVGTMSGMIHLRFKRTLKFARNMIQNPSPENFHKLRIKIKCLRYLCEFFEPVALVSLTELIRMMVEMQDCLGEMQDSVYARKAIGQYWSTVQADDKMSLTGSLSFDLGRLFQHQQTIYIENQFSFTEIWRNFDTQKNRDLINSLIHIHFDKPDSDGSGS